MLSSHSSDTDTRHALDIAARHGFQVTRLTVDGNTHQPGTPGFDSRLVLHVELRNDDQWGVRDAVEGGSFYNATNGQWDPERAVRCNQTAEEHRTYFATLPETLQRARTALDQRLDRVRANLPCPGCKTTTTVATATGHCPPCVIALCGRGSGADIGLPAPADTGTAVFALRAHLAHPCARSNCLVCALKSGHCPECTASITADARSTMERDHLIVDAFDDQLVLAIGCEGYALPVLRAAAFTPNFDGSLGTSMYLALSTAHLQQDTCDYLATYEGITALNIPDGWLMEVPLPEHAEEDASEHEWPAELLPIVRHAARNGCAFIRFHADSENITGLPTFHWSFRPPRPVVVAAATAPSGDRWQVLAEQEATTVYRTEVETAPISAQHGPHAAAGLADAVRAQALQLIAQGDAEIISTKRQPASMISWEVAGSALAGEALRYHANRAT